MALPVRLACWPGKVRSSQPLCRQPMGELKDEINPLLMGKSPELFQGAPSQILTLWGWQQECTKQKKNPCPQRAYVLTEVGETDQIKSKLHSMSEDEKCNREKSRRL